MSARHEPPALVRRWEALHVGVQVAIVAPLAVLLLWAAHVYLMNQPVGRGLAYGIFWGAIVTGAVVGASRAEAARRRAGGRRPGPPGR
jgi:hypothetical protein